MPLDPPSVAAAWQQAEAPPSTQAGGSSEPSNTAAAGFDFVARAAELVARRVPIQCILGTAAAAWIIQPAEAHRATLLPAELCAIPALATLRAIWTMALPASPHARWGRDWLIDPTYFDAHLAMIARCAGSARASSC